MTYELRSGSAATRVDWSADITEPEECGVAWIPQPSRAPQRVVLFSQLRAYENFTRRVATCTCAFRLRRNVF